MKHYLTGHDDIFGRLDGTFLPRRAPAAPTNLDAAIPYPHYSDDRWKQAQLVWGTEQRCTEVNYDDRLWQWDWDAGERAREATKGMDRTARMYQQWLSAYHSKPVVLRYVMAGCNWSSGYAYYVFGYDYEGGEV